MTRSTEPVCDPKENFFFCPVTAALWEEMEKLRNQFPSSDGEGHLRAIHSDFDRARKAYDAHHDVHRASRGSK